MSEALERSRALWNRERLDLESDEVLAQILDHGELPAWRELYALAAANPTLRRRIGEVVRRAPIGYPAFWLAALASLGETVDWNAPLPEDAAI